MSDDRFYAVRLLWVHDPERFAEYQERAKPILAKHGVHIERWLMTQDMDGDGLEERPDQIVVTWFRTAEAKAAFYVALWLGGLANRAGRKWGD